MADWRIENRFIKMQKEFAFSAKKKIVLFSLTFILVILICLSLGEIIIRIHYFSEKKEKSIRQPDSLLGFSLTPRNHFFYKDFQFNEYAVSHQTNSLGLLGAEISVPKDKNIFRILIFGDSFTEAMEVEELKNFCRQLQNLLNLHTISEDREFEVINAGLSGASPIIYYLYFKERLKILEPDLVLVQLFANDVFDDNRVRNKSFLDQQGLPVRIYPYFKHKYQNQGRNVLSLKLGKFFSRFQDWLAEHSRLWEYLNLAVVKSQKNDLLNKKLKQTPQFMDGYQFFAIDRQSQLWLDETFRTRALAQTQQYLLTLRKAVAEHNAAFAMFYIPMEAQLGLEKYSPHAELYFSKQADDSFNQELRRFSEEYQIDFLDLLPVFELQKMEKLYFSQNGHLNEVGHKIVASALLDFLQEKQLVPKN